MAVQRAYTSAAIHRMERLCTTAVADPEGVEIELNNRAEALKLRGQIYSARQALFRRSPDAETPLATVELRIENKGTLITDPHSLHILPQFTGLQDLKIKNKTTGDYVKLKPFAEENERAEIEAIIYQMRLDRGPVVLGFTRGASKEEEARLGKAYMDELLAREVEATELFNNGYRAPKVASAGGKSPGAFLPPSPTATIVEKTDWDFDPTKVEFTFGTE